MNKKFLFYVVMILLAVALLSACAPSAKFNAGLRASGYGISPFPQSVWWLNSSKSFSDGIEDSAPAVVWIVGTVQRGGGCWLTFPLPEGADKSDYENIRFAATDRNKSFLDLFDEQGVRVWLQVEPGAADIETLITLVMDQYTSHPSIIGFGVDVEWYLNEEVSEGKAVTDIEIESWVSRVQEFDQNYQIFLKHWLIEKMPPTFRDGVMFLDDSQGFSSVEHMMVEFRDWGEAFAPAHVGFQYGYLADRDWWETFDNPPVEIGNKLLEFIPNATELYWVDFSAEVIWPQE